MVVLRWQALQTSTDDGNTGLGTLASDGVAQGYERTCSCAGK